MDRFNTCLKTILLNEGGFVDHPKDPGGMTNLGVTKKTWEAWVGRGVTRDEMSGLTPALVAPLYLARYWQPSQCDKLPGGLDLCVFDHAVNAGPGRALKLLQASLGVSQDGIWGKQTKDALMRYTAADASRAYSAYRESFYRTRPNFDTFGRGWLRRVKDTLQEALRYDPDD